jgi:hypothetical protein
LTSGKLSSHLRWASVVTVLAVVRGRVSVLSLALGRAQARLRCPDRLQSAVEASAVRSQPCIGFGAATGAAGAVLYVRDRVLHRLLRFDRVLVLLGRLYARDVMLCLSQDHPPRTDPSTRATVRVPAQKTHALMSPDPDVVPAHGISSCWSRHGSDAGSSAPQAPPVRTESSNVRDRPRDGCC